MPTPATIEPRFPAVERNDEWIMSGIGPDVASTRRGCGSSCARQPDLILGHRWAPLVSHGQSVRRLLFHSRS